MYYVNQTIKNIKHNPTQNTKENDRIYTMGGNFTLFLKIKQNLNVNSKFYLPDYIKFIETFSH